VKWTQERRGETIGGRKMFTKKLETMEWGGLCVGIDFKYTTSRQWRGGGKEEGGESKSRTTSTWPIQKVWRALLLINTALQSGR